VISAFSSPLLNTILLLSSGATITYAHHALIASDRKGAIVGLLLTIILAVIFSGLQYVGYTEAADIALVNATPSPVVETSQKS